jgi:hypothetical protein
MAGKSNPRRNERGMHHLDATQDEQESLLKQLPPDWGHDSGYRARISPESRWCVIELDCWADPRKDPAWAREMVATIGMQRFQREFLRNWALSTQSPFYPEWMTRGGDEHFCRDVTELGKGEIHLGLDFGYRRPGVVLGQTNATRTRLYAIREWMPQNISAGAFCEVVEWLVGEYPKEECGTEALKHILQLERKAEEAKGPPVPWVHKPGKVHRWTSHEALRISQEVASESQERRVVDIWAAKGFPLHVQSEPVKQGELVMRHLLRPVPPRCLPYLVVDWSCEILRQGFGGGYTFKKPTKMQPLQNEPAKDGYYEHLQDGIRYMASQVIDIKAKVRDTVAVSDATQTRQKPARPADLGTYTRAKVGRQEAGDFSSEWDETGPARWTGDVYWRGE